MFLPPISLNVLVVLKTLVDRRNYFKYPKQHDILDKILIGKELTNTMLATSYKTDHSFSDKMCNVKS